MIQVQNFYLREVELSWEVSHSVDVEVQLCEEDKFVLSCLQCVNVIDLVLAKLDEFKHLTV